MTTKPEAWQEQGPVNSLNNESWTQGEVGAAISHNSLLQDKKAPRAEPEEDIDIMEPRTRDETLHENQTFALNKIVDGTKLDNQESTRISVCILREAPEIVTELEQESCVQSEHVFPPPPLLSDYEKEGFSSLEKEIAIWISDAEIISDPTEDLVSSDSPPEGMVEDNMTAEENDTQLNFLPDGFSNSEPENNTPGAAYNPPSDSNSLDDVHTMGSPPFADESEEEEQANMDITSCQQQLVSLNIKNKLLQPSYSADVSVSIEQETSAMSAVSSTKQQEELLTQSQYELAPRRGNQEAAEQVHGQSSPPLSAVSIEVSNQGGAVYQACGCVVAVRERHNRAGQRTKRESEQTGGEGQKKSVLERNKAGQQHSRAVLKAEKYTGGVSFTHSRHSRMESDSCDDSQSDSGVSADFSPCSTLEGNTTSSTGTPTSVTKETPIEKEIRRAIEREHSLRRSRGLPNPPTSPEYVDIPLRKTVLCQSLTAKSERYHGKDRQLAGKKMQHDIHKETQREQDLVKLGKVPGFYDKGTVRQLKDRKQIFEVFQKPSDSNLPVSARSKVISWSSASDISAVENKEDISQVSTIEGSCGGRRQSIDLLSPTQSHNLIKGGGSTDLTPQGPGFSEARGCQVIILENNLSVPALKLYHAQQEAAHITAVDSGNPYLSSSQTGRHSEITGRKQEKEEKDKEEEVAIKENPFFKLRPSTNLVKVEQDIREAQEREKELHKQRISLYGGMGGAKDGGGGGRSSNMEGKTLSPSSLNGLSVSDSSGSSSRGQTGPPVGEGSTEYGFRPKSVSIWGIADSICTHKITQTMCLYVWMLVCGGICVTFIAAMR